MTHSTDKQLPWQKASAATRNELAQALPHFNRINSYWDKERVRYAAKLLPGDYYVTTHSELVTIVLCSCVSACDREIRPGIGGVNHLILPRDGSQGSCAWGTTVTTPTDDRLLTQRERNFLRDLDAKPTDNDVELF